MWGGGRNNNKEECRSLWAAVTDQLPDKRRNRAGRRDRVFVWIGGCLLLQLEVARGDCAFCVGGAAAKGAHAARMQD